MQFINANVYYNLVKKKKGTFGGQNAEFGY